MTARAPGERRGGLGVRAPRGIQGPRGPSVGPVGRETGVSGLGQWNHNRGEKLWSRAQPPQADRRLLVGKGLSTAPGSMSHAG